MYSFEKINDDKITHLRTHVETMSSDPWVSLSTEKQTNLVMLLILLIKNRKN
jgi:hypothetical protein